MKCLNCPEPAREGSKLCHGCLDKAAAGYVPPPMTREEAAKMHFQKLRASRNKVRG